MACCFTWVRPLSELATDIISASRVRPLPTRRLAAGGRSTTSLIRYLWSVRSTIGVSRLTDLTPLDSLGVPVVAAIRPSANPGQITTCQGKGGSYREAVVGALMEAAERFSCSAHSSRVVKVQPSQITGGGDQGGTSSELSDAIYGVSLTSGAKHALRASAVLFPYRDWFPGQPGPRPNTSGLAAGLTRERALESALLELVERDSVSRFFEGNGATGVDAEATRDPTSQRLFDSFRRRGVEVLVAQLAPVGSIQTVKAFALDTLSCSPHLAVTGQASDLNLDLAIRKALLEVAQARATAIQASREDLRRYRATWQGRYEEVRESFEFLRQRLPVRAGTTIAGTPIVRRQDGALAAVLKALSEAGFSEVIAVDLTHEKVEIPVFRVLVPGLADTLAGSERIPHSVS